MLDHGVVEGSFIWRTSTTDRRNVANIYIYISANRPYKCFNAVANDGLCLSSRLENQVIHTASELDLYSSDWTVKNPNRWFMNMNICRFQMKAQKYIILFCDQVHILDIKFYWYCFALFFFKNIFKRMYEIILKK